MKPQLLNFPLIKFTICLAIGIVVAHFCSVPFLVVKYAIVVLFITLVLLFFVFKKQLKNTIWFGSITFITFVFIGMFVVISHNPKQLANHYSNVFYSEDNLEKEILFRVNTVLKPSHYNDRYFVSILKINSHEAVGKLLVNIKKELLKKPLPIDAVFSAKSTLHPIQKPLNPHGFNYKNYLENHYVYHQIYVSANTLFKVKSTKKTVLGYSNSIREHINLKLKKYAFKPSQLAIIKALLLGQRQDISKAVYSNYVNAGIIHILAISGLHVGIIFLLLNFLLNPLSRFKYGKTIKMLIIIFALWCFAIIAGLSASVTRAVTMFSIVAIAAFFKRPTNIYNTLAISMFILLLFKPLFLLDIGFQLSYLAVIFIVWLQPLLYNLWQPKFKVPDFFWKIFTVSLAAQLGVLPLSLFYFHQFPSLFWLSNLVVIPCTTYILGGGIFVICLSVLNCLPNFIVNIYGSGINLMNNFVAWISQHEQFLVSDISFGLLHVFIAYLLIILCIRFFRQKTYSRLKPILITVIAIQCFAIYFKNKKSNSFTIFNKSKFTVLGNKVGGALVVHHNLDSLAETTDRVIRNFKIGENIKILKKQSLKTVYLMGNKSLLVVDSLGVYKVKQFVPDYILLRGSPKLNLERLLNNTKPKVLIADGSNYKSYVKRWRETCLKQNIKFYYTGENGFFKINY